MNQSKTLFAAAVCALAVCACAPKEDLTQVMLDIDGDVRVGEDIDTVRIVLTGSGEPKTNDVQVGTGRGAQTFPLRMGVVRGADSLAGFRVLVIGLAESDEVVRQEHFVPFLEGQVRTLRVRLNRACALSVRAPCDDGYTCSAGQCIVTTRTEEDLLAWPPPQGSIDVTPGVDAAASDAASTTTKDADGSAPTDAADIPQITVMAIDPENEATNVETNRSIVVTLSEPPPADVANTMVVTANGRKLEGDVTADGSVITWKPKLPLPLASRVQITFGAMQASEGKTFKTKDGFWSEVGKLADSPVAFASNHKGNAIAAWTTATSFKAIQAKGSESFVSAGEVTVGENAGVNVAIDGSDRLSVITYTSAEGPFGSLALHRNLNEGAGWMPETFLSQGEDGDANQIIGNLFAAGNEKGDLAIVFRHVTNGTKVALRSPAGTWTTRAVGASQAGTPTFAFSESGQYAYTSMAAGTAKLTVASGDGSKEFYQRNLGDESGSAGVLANGEVLVATKLSTSTRILVRRVGKDGTVVTMPELDIAEGKVGALSLAVNESGHAIIAWTVAATDTVKVSIRSPNGAWSLPQEIQERGYSVAEPEVAIDAAGNAMLVYSTGGRLQAHRFLPTAGWDEAGAFSFVPMDGTVSSARMTVDVSGRIWLVWTESYTSGTATMISSKWRRWR